MEHALFIGWGNGRAAGDDIYSWADYFECPADDIDTWNDWLCMLWM